MRIRYNLVADARIPFVTLLVFPEQLHSPIVLTLTTLPGIVGFLSGLGGSAPLGIGAGVIADMWRNEERGTAVAIYSLGPLLVSSNVLAFCRTGMSILLTSILGRSIDQGPAIGPCMGGWISEKLPNDGYKWIFFSTTIVRYFRPFCFQVDRSVLTFLQSLQVLLPYSNPGHALSQGDILSCTLAAAGERDEEGDGTRSGLGQGADNLPASKWKAFVRLDHSTWIGETVCDDISRANLAAAFIADGAELRNRLS